MMNEALQSIKQGLTEAIEFTQGQTHDAVVHEFAPLDIKAVRKSWHDANRICNHLWDQSGNVTTLGAWRPKTASASFGFVECRGERTRGSFEGFTVGIVPALP